MMQNLFYRSRGWGRSHSYYHFGRYI